MDKQEELRAELERHKGVQSDLKALLSSRGWARLAEVLRARAMQTREQDYGSGIESMDDAFRSANRRGEIAGVQFALNLPSLLIEDHERDIDRVKEQMGQEHA